MLAMWVLLQSPVARPGCQSLDRVWIDTGVRDRSCQHQFAQIQDLRLSGCLNLEKKLASE